jgi:integrase
VKDKSVKETKSIRLTAVEIGRLGPGEWRDTHTRGLLLIVRASGNSWSLRYSVAGGKRQRLLIGPYPEFSLADARAKAAELGVEIAKGADPKGDDAAKKGSITFQQLAELMLAENTRLSSASKDAYRYCFQRDVYPVIGSKPAATVTQDDVRSIQKAAINRGADTKGDKLRSVIGSVFTWASKFSPLPMLTTNPAHGIGAISPGIKRDVRPWTNDEMKAIFRELEPVNEASLPALPNGEPDRRHVRVVCASMRDIVRLTVMLGTRRAEVTGMTLDELDLDAEGGALWTIEGSTNTKRGRMKNGKKKILPLPTQAVAIIKAAIVRLERKRNGKLPVDACIFPPAISTSVYSHIDVKSVTTAVHRIAIRIGAGNRKGKEGLHLHDTRSTFVMWATEEDISGDVQDYVLHHMGTSTRDLHYKEFSMKFIQGRVRLALQAYADHVERVTQPNGATATNVVAFRA